MVEYAVVFTALPLLGPMRSKTGLMKWMVLDKQHYVQGAELTRSSVPGVAFRSMVDS